MMPISGADTGVVQPLTTSEEVLGAARIQKPEEESQGRQMKPVMDEYIRSEPQEPSGRYWMGKDEDGQPKIYFDDPERSADGPKQPEGKKDKDEVWEGNSDRVDREIEKLKKKKEELERRLNTETDEVKIKNLECQLSLVERELKQKDNDSYRHQHTTVRQLS